MTIFLVDVIPQQMQMPDLSRKKISRREQNFKKTEF